MSLYMKAARRIRVAMSRGVVGRTVGFSRKKQPAGKEKLWLFGLPLRHPNNQSLSVRRRFALIRVR